MKLESRDSLNKKRVARTILEVAHALFANARVRIAGMVGGAEF